MATTRRKFLSILLAAPALLRLPKLLTPKAPPMLAAGEPLIAQPVIDAYRITYPDGEQWLFSGYVMNTPRRNSFGIFPSLNPMTRAERTRENVRYQRHFRPSDKMTDFLRRQA